MRRTNSPTMYTFRFADASRVVSLSQDQLERIPYLFEMVSCPDQTTSKRNTRGEWMLTYRIRYPSFTAILASVTARRSAFLFTILPQRCNVLSMLNRYEYLRIDPLPVPAFAQEKNEIDDELFFQAFCRVRPSEVRDSAVEFVAAIGMGKYNFNGIANVENIVYLLGVILSHPEFFGPCMRYHTSAIVETCCRSIFDSAQMSRLQAYRNPVVPDDEDTADEEDDQQYLSLRSEEIIYWRKHINTSRDEDDHQHLSLRPPRQWILLSTAHIYLRLRPFEFLPHISLSILRPHDDETTLDSNQVNVYADDEAKWARAGYFNTLPRRSMHNRCKHRSNAKAQKHR